MESTFPWPLRRRRKIFARGDPVIFRGRRKFRIFMNTPRLFGRQRSQISGPPEKREIPPPEFAPEVAEKLSSLRAACSRTDRGAFRVFLDAGFRATFPGENRSLEGRFPKGFPGIDSLGESRFSRVDPGSTDPGACPNRGPLQALPGGVIKITEHDENRTTIWNRGRG